LSKVISVKQENHDRKYADSSESINIKFLAFYSNSFIISIYSKTFLIFWSSGFSVEFESSSVEFESSSGTSR